MRRMGVARLSPPAEHRMGTAQRATVRKCRSSVRRIRPLRLVSYSCCPQLSWWPLAGHRIMGGSDSKVEGGCPSWNEHIGRVSAVGPWVFRAGLGQFRLLDLRIEPRCEGEGGHAVMCCLMPTGAISAACAKHRVPTFVVQDRMACWAPGVPRQDVIQKVGAKFSFEIDWGPGQPEFFFGGHFQEA